MKKEARNKPLLECGYCNTYLNIPTKYRYLQSRYCYAVKTQVSVKDKSCSSFELNSWFFCRKAKCQIDYVVCIARQKNRMNGCCNCSQGKAIQKYLLWRDGKEKIDVEPRREKRIKRFNNSD